MELKQSMLRGAQKIHQNQNHTKTFTGISTNSSRTSNSQAANDLCTSFRTLEMGVPKTESEEEKLCWLKSQVIGGDAYFDSPFGKRRLTYADHTASARSLHYIENFIINNILPFYGNSHTQDSYVGHRTTKMVQEAAAYIKRCLGGGEEDALLFCGSGTTAAIKRLQEVMGISVPSILRDRVLTSLLGSEERWVVFVGPYEHHSNLLSWRQSLAQVVEIGLDENGLVDMETLRLELEAYQYSNRPMLGSFSACSNVTGTYSDTRALAQLLHKYGAFASFDFAASGPYVEIDMRSGEVDGYDAIFLSPHKFLGGPGSPGILLMSKTFYQLKSSSPSTCGGGVVSYVNGFNEKDTIYLDDIEERENAGTPQIIQTIRAALAFWVKESVGYELIEKQEQNYIERALKMLLPIQNMWVLGNTSAKRQAILSFLVYSTTNGSVCLWGETSSMRGKPLHGPFIATLLNDLFGIQARGGCDCAGPYGHTLLNVDRTLSHNIRDAIQKGYVGVKPGWTRISFPYYMSNAEFEFIIAALKFVATYGQRFLSLYHFNFRTGNWTLKKKALKEIEERNNNGDAAAKHEHKYASYLETASHIATLLPNFPSQRRLPQHIHLNLLYFRV